jgi:hypothetical protein
VDVLALPDSLEERVKTGLDHSLKRDVPVGLDNDGFGKVHQVLIQKHGISPNPIGAHDDDDFVENLNLDMQFGIDCAGKNPSPVLAQTEIRSASLPWAGVLFIGFVSGFKIHLADLAFDELLQEAMQFRHQPSQINRQNISIIQQPPQETSSENPQAE